MPHLLIQGSTARVERFDLADGELRIGRGEECELRLPNVSVSRVHCTLRVAQGQVTAVDAGSQNGTLVNGNPIFEQQLHSRDELTIGRFRLVLLGDGDKDRFYKGRFVGYLPEYKPSAGLTDAAPEATFAMNVEDLQRMSGARQVVDEARLVLAADPNRFWHPEEKGVTIGGGQALVPAKGWGTWGVVADVTWDGKQHVLTKRALFGSVKVNDRSTTRQPLKNGDIVQIGRTTFRYEAPEPVIRRSGGRRQTFRPGTDG